VNALLYPLEQLESFQTLKSATLSRRSPVLASGAVDTKKSHLTVGLMEALSRPALVVTHSELKAKEIHEDMQFFFRNRALFYPSKDIIFYAADVKSAAITKQRFAVLERLRHQEENLVIVLSVEALFDRLTPPAVFRDFTLTVATGDRLPVDELVERLVLMGYERSELVEGPGQFALRGGILDVYTTVYDNPLRIEFFDDEVDSIRLVDSLSQRSVEKKDHVLIYPMRELVYSDDTLKKAIGRIQKEYVTVHAGAFQKGLHEEAKNLHQYAGEILEKLSEQKGFRGVEQFSQYFYPEGACLLDYLPDDTLLIFDEPSRIAEHVQTVTTEFQESIQNRVLKGQMLPSQTSMIFGYGEILSRAKTFATVLYTALTQSVRDFTVRELSSFSVKSSGTFKQRMDLLAEDLKYWTQNSYSVLLLAGARFHGQRLANEILDQGIPAKYEEDLSGSELERGKVTVTRGSLATGFEYTLLKFAVISDKELFGEQKERKRKRRQKGAKIENFTELRVGDYIVHDAHGIGVYKGIEQIQVDSTARDYLKLEYADGGAIYVQTGQMDQIQKYIGGDNVKPKLNKLGGMAWAAAKGRARQAVTIMASELVGLYAKRQKAKAFVYSEDTVWQREFEELFPYEETEDQLAAIEDVKRDMESGQIMDRLLCGDVGYGKTEVALRAAFKAVQDGKQVAYLVPTTILAQQHYNTFIQRMKDFPIGVEMLSRFRTAKQQQESIKKLETGQSDIVIGTHRLLSKDLRFKDLGLIIVDEEQRFGVGHKEKLKTLKENVDVLTLTATPIPRTLHMSLTGIRDMSLLEEPPEERQPVQTYVMEYNPAFVKDAIQRELARNGQVYYLHNRVRNIAEEAARVQALVPDAVVAYAHGQMSEHELENVMMDFIQGEVNVLVCTTIIETGLDIANVNTIIIQDADFMGLGQLYQLRGRVGRSSRLAYAYLMYRKDKVLTEVSEKRLQTIREFTEFGSGYRIAMRDLEIRGAGNLLGQQQHGHMDAVGYDMYTRLLTEAVAELKGEAMEETFETFIDIKVNAHIPPDYIPNEIQKLDMYKKISAIQSETQMFDVQEEFEDRFGEIPVCVQNLLEVALIKAGAHRLGVLSVIQKQSGLERTGGACLIVTFKQDAPVELISLTEMITANKHMLFTAAQNPYITIRLGENADLLAVLWGVVKGLTLENRG